MTTRRVHSLSDKFTQKLQANTEIMQIILTILYITVLKLIEVVSLEIWTKTTNEHLTKQTDLKCRTIHNLPANYLFATIAIVIIYIANTELNSSLLTSSLGSGCGPRHCSSRLLLVTDAGATVVIVVRTCRLTTSNTFCPWGTWRSMPTVAIWVLPIMSTPFT